ncbi:hypothetical protein GF340_03625, partial [Candidatus Peregrinibacteria bacterium]|nr:hypothetical protein [Candidatus Peregrinibacteria bacterium]
MPHPDEMLSTGLLVRTEPVRLSRHLQLRRYQLLASDCPSDFYPINTATAEPVHRLMPKLYDRRGLKWREVGFARLGREDVPPTIFVSGDG